MTLKFNPFINSVNTVSLNTRRVGKRSIFKGDFFQKSVKIPELKNQSRFKNQKYRNLTNSINFCPGKLTTGLIKFLPDYIIQAGLPESGQADYK